MRSPEAHQLRILLPESFPIILTGCTFGSPEIDSRASLLSIFRVQYSITCAFYTSVIEPVKLFFTQTSGFFCGFQWFVGRQQKWNKFTFELESNFSSSFCYFTVIILPFKDCFLLQFSSPFKDLFTSARVNIIRCHIAKSLMIPLAVVPTDKPRYFLLQLFGRLPYMQEDTLFYGTMIPLNLPGGLRMVRWSTDMTNTFSLQILAKVLRDQSLAITLSNFTLFSTGTSCMPVASQASSTTSLNAPASIFALSCVLCQLLTIKTVGLSSRIGHTRCLAGHHCFGRKTGRS